MSVKKPRVIHRPKHDKRLEKEPAMIKLRDLLESGKVDPERVFRHLEDEETSLKKPGWKQKMNMQTARLSLRISPHTHERLKHISMARGISVNDLVNDVLNRFCKRQLKRLMNELGESKSISGNQKAHGGAPGGRERGSEPGIPPFSISKLPG